MGNSPLSRLEKVSFITQLLLPVFVLGMKVKHLDKGLKRTLLFVVWIVPFLLVDVLYNFLVGTYIFKELPQVRVDPKEVLLTYRLKRLKVFGTPREKEAVFVLADILNKYDPSHI